MEEAVVEERVAVEVSGLRLRVLFTTRIAIKGYYQHKHQYKGYSTTRIRKDFCKGYEIWSQEGGSGPGLKV